MRKKILFFTEQPPTDPAAIHVWVGKTHLSHEECLCQLIGRYLGTPPLRLAKTSMGKLYLPNSSLYFNLSDVEDWLAVAFSWEAPVGIDLETVRLIEEMQQLILDYFSSKEQAYVNERETLARFWEIWTRKEACCKALGAGLPSNMAQWDCCGTDWICVNKVWVKSVPIQKGFSAAVALCCQETSPSCITRLNG